MITNLRRTWGAIGRTRLGRRPHAQLLSALATAHEIEVLDRPRWLYRPGDRVPSGEFVFRAPQPSSDAELALCERLIAAHALARADSRGPQGVWAHEAFTERHRDLHAALLRRDPEHLATTLGSMFRSDLVLGMAAGTLGVDQPRLKRRLLWLTTLSRLTSLAESRGATRMENPEQGVVGVGLSEGLETMVQRTESALGVSLDFPAVGAAYGIDVAGRLITPDSPDQIYGAARLSDAIALQLGTDCARPHVVEIGGGYGGMAYWLLQMRDAAYTIVDLPIVNVIHGYFLGRALGDDVAFYGEPGAKVTIVPDHALAAVRTPFEVLANKDSMPEIPRAAVLNYLRWASTACSGLFYSYNHETGAVFDGTEQGVVPEAVAEAGGFRLVRRDYSWMRRGYAEELYAPVPEPG